MFPTHESKWDNNRLWDKGVGEEALHSVKIVYRSGKTKLRTCLPRGPRSRWARPMSSPPLRAIPTEQGYILPKGPPPEREKSPQRAPQWVRTSWARPMSSPPLRAIPTEQGYILPKGPPPEREKSPQRAPQWVRTSCNPSQRAIIPHERGPYGTLPMGPRIPSERGPILYKSIPMVTVVTCESMGKSVTCIGSTSSHKYTKCIPHDEPQALLLSP